MQCPKQVERRVSSNEKEYICFYDLRNRWRYFICTWNVYGADPGVECISTGRHYGIAGALLFGIGMCLTMVWSHMVAGIVTGIVGIVVLLCLIPFIKGLK